MPTPIATKTPSITRLNERGEIAEHGPEGMTEK